MYPTKTRVDKKKTKQKINNVEMKTLTTITCLALASRRTKNSIRKECKVRNVNKMSLNSQNM